MRTRTILAGAALVLATTSGAGAGLAAAAVPQAGPAPAACSGPVVKAAEAVKVRSEPTTHSTAVGQLDKGEKTCVVGATEGGSHDACGVVEPYWSEIKYGGEKRYVPSACLEE